LKLTLLQAVGVMSSCAAALELHYRLRKVTGKLAEIHPMTVETDADASCWGDE
jgi:hypothetical protein